MLDHTAYNQRAAMHGAYCELDALYGTPPVGYIVIEDSGWRKWQIYHESAPSCPLHRLV